MNNLIIKYAIGLIVSCTLSNCVSTYQNLSPEEFYPINDYLYSYPNSNVVISLDYDVLIEPSNNIYSKMEKKKAISLIVIYIQNSGQKNLFLFEDLIFQTISGDTILPLTLTSAMDILVKPVTNESQINVDGNVSWIWGTGKAVNQTKTVISHYRFITDMEKYYIEDCILEAGVDTTGFLVLPVKKATPLIISLIEH